MRFQRLVALLAVSSIAIVTASCSSADDADEMTTTAPTETTATSDSTPAAATATTTAEPWTRSTLTVTTPPPEPTDPLTGLAESDNPVIAVKIENTSNGMPQYGISRADIIYTEQVEGGLVRLIAVYHTDLPEEVGAVRSIRSTDIQLLPSFGSPVLVSSGGNAAILRLQRNSPMVGVMEGAAGFWRSPARYAPYNLHANLQTIAENYGENATVQPMGFEFAVQDNRIADARVANSISVTMRNGHTSFTYDDDRYQAYFSGNPYLDAADQSTVFVDNIIVQHVANAPDGVIDPAGNPSYLTSTLGSGGFTLYRDGVAIDGTWSRETTSDPTLFADSDGEAVTLHPGRTWVLLAPQGSDISDSE